MVDYFYCLNCALDIGNTHTYIQRDKERTSQEEMSRKDVGDENMKWIMLVLANLEMGSNSPTTSACLKSQVFLGRGGNRLCG